MTLMPLAAVHLAGASLVAALAIDPSTGTTVESALGGPATVEADGPNAFGLPAPVLSREERRAFNVGNSFFRDNWVAAPASAAGRDGLGPIFNASSCSACHPDDGRGRPPRDASERGVGMVAFVSPFDADGAAHPVYGGQIQDQAIAGFAPEARLLLASESSHGAFADGTPYRLERWNPRFVEESHGPMGPVRVSLRLGQQLVGVGLLEAVDDATLIAIADPDDRDGDGISGRAHVIRGADGRTRVGRFGWKASQPTLEAQVIAALHGDMGITSAERPDDPFTDRQRAAIDPKVVAAASGGGPEIDQHKIARIAHYCRVLAVPRQRGAGTPEVERGRAIFREAGCASCHRPVLETGVASPIEAYRGVTIRPYTDLLLHDMGEGLADDRRDGDAGGREWRTPPLWGIGLLETVNGSARYLHDGRAATLEEAILWHGGEAQASRDAYLRLDRAARAALIDFLESL